MLSFTELAVIDCEASGAQAIIIITHGTSAYFQDDLFTNNTLRVPVDGGNVICDGHGAKAEFKDCSFQGNVAEGSGGAIVIYGCDVFVTNCSFRGNKAGLYGGAIMAVAKVHLEVLSSSFEGKT